MAIHNKIVSQANKIHFPKLFFLISKLQYWSIKRWKLQKVQIDSKIEKLLFDHEPKLLITLGLCAPQT